ncbi:hypothetical protein [Nitrososphaera sp.]|uniref:hypothetical protein n=1 Tax=Nitrososphaera sp. TaxID=1971748 RepID=UPI00307D2C6D
MKAVLRRASITSIRVIIILLALLILPLLLGSIFALDAQAIGSEDDNSSELTIFARDMDGHDLIGKHIELLYKDTLVDSGFVPHTFTLQNSLEYRIGIADYGRYTFDHWADNGSVDRWRSITVTDDTQLMAIYRIIMDAQQLSGSTIGSANQSNDNNNENGGNIVFRGGGGRAVIILSPEGAEPVNPGNFGVYGAAVGRPTSVEIAIKNPTTGHGTNYRPVTPIAENDFSKWSYSFAIDDLNMTQINVKAVYSDGSERHASVEVYYYVLAANMPQSSNGSTIASNSLSGSNGQRITHFPLSSSVGVIGQGISNTGNAHALIKSLQSGDQTLQHLPSSTNSTDFISHTVAFSNSTNRNNNTDANSITGNPSDNTRILGILSISGSVALVIAALLFYTRKPTPSLSLL